MSKQYTFTERGTEMANSAGLASIAEKFDIDDLTEMFGLSTRDMHMLYDENIERRAEILGNAVNKFYPVYPERFGRLSRTEDDNTWRYVDGNENDGRLFEVPKLVDFVPSDHTDRLVLSGAVGLAAEGKSKRIRRMLKEVQPHLGDRMEAAVFAGAYILSSVIEAEETRFRQRPPSFTRHLGSLVSTVSIAADFHGDFRMHEKHEVKSGPVAPDGSQVEFAPARGLTVAGYHSVEPSITAAMLEHVLVKEGVEEVRRLIAELREVENILSNGNNGEIGFRAGAFGDYGYEGFGYELFAFRAALEGRYCRHGEELLSDAYLPQSTTNFVIKSEANGLAFFNVSGEGVAGASIEVSREEFVNLYFALLQQASGGLGRTAPYQHVKLLKKAEKMLDDPSVGEVDDYCEQ